MARRSLVASTEGIKLAKKALERLSLTQKALAEEKAIASWSTINGFFNSKPVDRSIFIEICQALNLDWQKIVSSSPKIDEEEEIEKNEEISTELSTVQRNAYRARTALEPYILPCIRREILLEKCLKAIQRGIKGKRRVIPILGAAGYGKSTILGTIYDELDQERVSGSGWVALVRCNDLIESQETFAIELGENVSGVREPIADITSRLTAQHGRGVLLIDTLDLVLDKKLVPVLRGIFLELLDSNTTVVFTCRESDYRDFFEPYHESFAGFAESIECCQIPEFDDGEVREAARAFVQTKLGVTTSEGSLDFAQKIIALSSDSKSLQDITRNPLLLALLCDLFASEENVPEDLTVSQLYAKYWDLRIAQGRKNRENSRRIGMAKKNLCLEIAQLLYEKSQERLRDSIYESDLELNGTVFAAYEELKSDGVLKELGGSRLVFFHQTFLEYAIARWLDSTEAGELAKNQLLSTLKQPNTSYTRHYVWPIVRQLLNLVNLREFYRIYNRLDQQELLPFRAVAFAAVSRFEVEVASVLRQQLPIALQLGDVYQDTLLVAAKSAPTRHVGTVWEIAIALLAHSSQRVADKAAEIAGELLYRLKNHRGEHLSFALQTIKTRTAENKSSSPDERTHLLGKLIGSYATTLNLLGKTVDVEVLPPLKEYYVLLGGKTRAVALELYLNPGVPESLLRECLMTILSKPISEQLKEKERAINLLQQLLPSLLKTGDSPFGHSKIDALLAPLAKDWDLVQAGAIGKIAVDEPELVATLLDALFRENLSAGDGVSMRRYQVAISEAIRNGAGNCVAKKLLNIPIETLPQNRFSTLSVLIRELSVQLGEEYLESLARWIAPKIGQCPLEFIPTIDTLAKNSARVSKLLGEILEQVLPTLTQQQANQIIKKLNFVPESFVSYLQATANHKESRKALVKVYHSQAQNSSSSNAVSELLKLCLDESRDVALDAANVILNLAVNQTPIRVAEVIPILTRSKIVGVRKNCLMALGELVKAGFTVTESEMIEVCTILASDTLPEAIQPLYKLIEYWVQANQFIPLALASATFELTKRLATKNPLHSGIAQSAFITLKNIANLEDCRLNLYLSECTHQLWRATDVNAINSLFVIGLLNSVAKFDAGFLSQIVKTYFVTESEMRIANLNTAIVAIIYSQGKYSPLLDEILNDVRFPSEVKGQIIRERGA